MPNPLTGDFDVVAQFSIPAANRVLAAMHRVDRFPHSMSIRVKDIRRPRRDAVDPSIVETVDRFGDPVSDQDRIGNPNPFPGLLASTDSVYFALDPIVNIGNAGLLEEPIQPSNLQGRAQIQVFPPTIEVADSSGTNINVNLEMLSRYLPDKDTSPAAEFIRADLRLTVPIHQVASQNAKMIEIDIKANSLGLSFVPKWSSQPLTAEDLTAINLLIRNALKTSFLPSSSEVPANIKYMQFRTLQGSTNAVAALLNLTDEVPRNINSASNVFLGTSDDFAFSVGVDFVKSRFQATIDKFLGTPIAKTNSYTIVLDDASIDLLNGQIKLTIHGHATSPDWYRPNFGFTLEQWFSFQVNGDTADIIVGALSFNPDSWIVDLIRGRIRNRLQTARDAALAESGTLDTFRETLSASKNLGGLVDSLMKASRRKPGEAPEAPDFQFAYSSLEVSPVGIVLRGSVAVSAWSPAHVEFEQIPMSNQGSLGGAGATGVNQGPDYSALKSWIPGGTVLRYEWKSQSQSLPGLVEENKFVYLHPGLSVSTGVAANVVSGFQPLCLTVHGSRLSSSGPVVSEAVSATACGVNSFPISGAFAADAELLSLALAQPGPQGRVEVVGHTSARRATRGDVAPNLIVHFGEARSAGNLERLIQALRESARDDAPTAILVVMSAEELSAAPYIDGVTYADNQNGAWERRFGLRITRRPFTAVVSPEGKTVWQHEGEIEPTALAAALQRSLVAGKPVEATMPAPILRIGQTSPNFLFEYAPGREVTLRKAAGRPIVMVFWRSTSAQSLDLIRNLERTVASDSERTLILAINDGEPAELARQIAEQNRFESTLVTDPARSISRAYGVNTWPTTVGTDASGRVRAIRFGRLAGETPDAPIEQTRSDFARSAQ